MSTVMVGLVVSQGLGVCWEDEGENRGFIDVVNVKITQSCMKLF